MEYQYRPIKIKLPDLHFKHPTMHTEDAEIMQNETKKLICSMLKGWVFKMQL